VSWYNPVDWFTKRVPLEAEPEERAPIDRFDVGALVAPKSPSGKSITEATALEGTVAVFAAVSLLADSVGQLPCLTYRRLDERNRERISETPERFPGSLARTLHQSPNPEMTAPEYWGTVVGHAATWGNHFSYIVRDPYGRTKELWPLRPDRMEVWQLEGRQGMPAARAYVYHLPDGKPVGLTRNEVFHVMALSSDGITGMSPISAAANAIGIEQAAAEYTARFFANSAVPGGVLQSEKALTKEQSKHLKEQWQSIVGGLSNANRIAVLHSGVTWQAVGLPPRDNEFLELRRFQIQEVARLFRIPLHLLQENTGSTSWGTGIEQMTIGFVVFCLNPWVGRITAAINRDLGDVAANKTLLDEGIYAEFQVNALLRGDMASRAAFYQSGIQNSWMTPEDVRAFENLPYIPGIDRPQIQVNRAPIGVDGLPQLPEPPAPPAPSEPPEEPADGDPSEEDEQ